MHDLMLAKNKAIVGPVIEKSVVGSSISDETVIGRGRTADIHAWGRGKAVKLFHPRWGREEVEREASISVAVHAIGLPTPRVYNETFEVDGRIGIVFERVTGTSMLHHFAGKPWTLPALVNSFSQLHVTMHAQRVHSLPSQREQLLYMINRARLLSTQLRETVLAVLDRLPDGDALTHGDYHPDNVVVSDQGATIIDWHTASQGNPAADVAYTALLFRLGALPPTGIERWLYELGRELARSTYLRTYKKLSDITQAEINAWALPVAAARLGAGIPEEERSLLKLIISLATKASETKGRPL